MITFILTAQLALASALPHSVVVNGQACTVRTLCPSTKPKPVAPVKLDPFLYMCMYLEPLMYVLPADAVPMTLNIPDSPALPDETPLVAALTPIGVTYTPDVAPIGSNGGFWIPSVPAGGGWGSVVPRVVPAPEIDPSGTVTSLTLLLGALVIVGGRRKL